MEGCRVKETVHKCHSDPGGNQETPGAKNRSCPASRKCILTLDGYSYVIVASPPDGQIMQLQDSTLPSCGTSENKQLADTRSIIEKSSSVEHMKKAAPEAGPSTTGDFLDELPAVGNSSACSKAALRLRCLLRMLDCGEVSAEILQSNLLYAANVLEAAFVDESNSSSEKIGRTPGKSDSSSRVADEDDELSEVQPDAVPPEVREWLASTFTRQLGTTRRKADEKPKFRSVAYAIRAGLFVDRMYRRVTSTNMMHFPPEVIRILKIMDEWSFSVFALNRASGGQPIKYLGYDLLNRYGLIHKFKIPHLTLETFLTRIEEGYCKYQNPYHNNLHAADVAQTVHYLLCQTGLMNWLSDLEIFATLVAALIHDYEHTGTTNNFHVMSGSDTALLYNDRAVLENHHISASFRLLKEEDCNILQNLSREEYREFRSLVIDMVLATDMSFHFQQLKNMKNMLSAAEASIDKSKALSLVLHCCDISHPAKRWDLHKKWTSLLLEEFFRQGDMERDLGLPFSPLCDRNTTLVAESQIGFIEFIVEPSLAVCTDLLESIMSSLKQADMDSENRVPIKKPWLQTLAVNKKKWKEQAVKEVEVEQEPIPPPLTQNTEEDKGENRV